MRSLFSLFGSSPGVRPLDGGVEQAGVDADGREAAGGLGDRQPDDEQDGPEDQEGDGVGQHGGGDGADAGVSVVALGKDHNHGEVGHQRGDDVGAGVANAVGQLRQLGAVAQQHEHGDKHRGQDVPLGGGGAHEQVHERGEQHENDHQRDQADVDGVQEVGAVQGDDGAQLGVVEVLDELGGDEGQGQEGAHGGHGLAQGVADFPGGP